eukprot:CAMPEP_0117083892 /NCGR_PEP_ID=MMETSP0472-20121206/59062_1 /TAXON_ID=693140 ORGANISM="Tiarina fusus, Strain LIS" /NCGR_SAMPLE_ID=MMETSP0472 /ASSEMBLY_ACC=CAM_ASM_000603 /LENGTH=573 /DNA_ID=CAMNT_0004812695 /DNA_START=74 /DNA_END=1795 /DNA_ORIENTATION=-
MRHSQPMPRSRHLCAWFLFISTIVFPGTNGFVLPLGQRYSISTTSSLGSTTSSKNTPSSKSYDVFDADKEEAIQAKKKLVLKKQKREHGQKQKDDQEWKFFDTARIHVSGGDGGNGCVAFRREKGAPLGGPSGGRGGRGGSIWLVCDESMNTLAPLRNRVHVRAIKGRNGLGKNKDGQKGKHIVIPVPPGTVVRELQTQKLAGELTKEGDKILVARGGRLVADVGFLGKPNAGKSTLLAAASAARPKIANYPFTTIVPNLGVCDLGSEGSGLVMCDIPGLIEGAAKGAGLGPAFLRHVQRCKVLLHVVDGTSEDPIGDFVTINKELEEYDPFLAEKPQVVVLNKMDVPEVKAKSEELVAALTEKAGHSRVLTISAATTERVKELMGRLKKFVQAQPESDLPPIPEVDLGKAGLDYDSDDYEIISDPSYPGQWRISGEYIEQIARMTHWEYPEAVARFGRQLDALGIAKELQHRGAETGDLVMVDEYDFEFNPNLTNMYIPQYLLEREEGLKKPPKEEEEDEGTPWRPFPQGGFLDVDTDELVGFSESEDWDLLDDDWDDDDDFEFSDDEVWTA